jgi:hypothetical protein
MITEQNAILVATKEGIITMDANQPQEQDSSTRVDIHALKKRHQKPTNMKKKKMILAVVAVLVLLLVMIGLWWRYGNFGLDRGKYQAVFLNGNNQVFFGKLKNTKGEYLQLDKAYYVQPQTTGADGKTKSTGNDVTLVKVGDGVYGPEDSMMIRSSQVSFWQNLRSDSKVSKTIDSAKN